MDEALVESRVFASIDEVPTFEWKTPLQRAIQILKRHRDVMFSSVPKLKPLSMVITTLSAEAYQGEPDLRDALTNIVNEMPRFVRSVKPRIPNPVDPAEDFADKWTGDPRLEENFRLWHLEAKADLERLFNSSDAAEAGRLFKEAFGIGVSEEVEKRIAPLYRKTSPVAFPQPTTTRIVAAPRPWRRG